MSDLGRNDPCLCGSGKKYKNCCLRRHEQEDRWSAEVVQAVTVAVDWLSEHHEEELDAAIDEGFFGGLEDVTSEELSEAMEPDDADVVWDNAYEWVLAETVLEDDDGSYRLVDLVLGEGGPALTPEQRRALEEMATRPLSLYRVVTARPGGPVEVEDLLAEGGGKLQLWEQEWDQEVEGEVLGLRLLPRGEGWLASGAIYYFPGELAKLMVEGLGEELAAEDDEQGRRDLRGSRIAANWLAALVLSVFAEEEGDGAEIYQVHDWDALRAALVAQPDVEELPDDAWVRYEQNEGEERRPQLYLSRFEDELELIGADEGIGAAREWLEGLAGDTVTYLEPEDDEDDEDDEDEDEDDDDFDDDDDDFDDDDFDEDDDDDDDDFEGGKNNGSRPQA